MKSIREIISNAVAIRLDEVEEGKMADGSITELFDDLSEEYKSRFLEAESAMMREFARREEKIYLLGVKDGIQLYDCFRTM